MTPEEFALCSGTRWKRPETLGKYFVMPATAITLGEEAQAKGEFKYLKEISNSYDVILIVLKATFEWVIGGRIKLS